MPQVFILNRVDLERYSAFVNFVFVSENREWNISFHKIIMKKVIILLNCGNILIIIRSKHQKKYYSRNNSRMIAVKLFHSLYSKQYKVALSSICFKICHVNEFFIFTGVDQNKDS